MKPDQLELLDDATLDHLPYGVIRLGPTGRIERCNRAELERARLQRWRVLGRDYCRELVGRQGPAMSAKIAALAPGQRARVEVTLDRYRGGDRVVIEIVRRADGGAYLCISAECPRRAVRDERRYIKNATLRAAFLAAEDGGPITTGHLERAALVEYEGMGKIAFQAAFG